MEKVVIPHRDRGVSADLANVPAPLRNGTLTLASKQLYRMVIEGAAPMTEDEARALGYTEAEIAAYFGEAGREAAALPSVLRFCIQLGSLPRPRRVRIRSESL